MPQFFNDTVTKNQESRFIIHKSLHHTYPRHNYLFLIVLLLLMPSIQAQCYTSTHFGSNKICTICLLGGNFQSCTYNHDTTNSTPLNQFSCSLYCCAFDYQTTINFCNSNSDSNASTTDNSKLATILIVIFFTIPATVCLCIIIISCLRRRAERLERIVANNDAPASSINLQNFNIDQIGPLFQDKKQACSICLQENGNLRTKCGHIYHPQCLLAWVHKKSTCPLCVSREFNPIILYCNKCFKSVKLAVIFEDMNPAALQQLTNSQTLLCEACTGLRRHQNEISIDIEIASEKYEDKEQEKERQNGQNKIKKSESSQSALGQEQ